MLSSAMTEFAQIAVTAADIRAARARLDESQTEFARRCGVSRGTLASWESLGPPDPGTAHRMVLDRVLAEVDSYVQEPVK